LIANSQLPIDSLKFFHFTSAQINESEVLVSRSGYTGELGYELYIPAEDAGGVWEFLLKKGKEWGLQPYGVLAMQSLRIEKGFPLYGPDMNEEVTPFHMGLDRWIRFDKREFMGREALLRVQETGIQERWVGLILDGNSTANHNDPIHSISDVASFRRKKRSGSEAGEQSDATNAGEQIGRITSSAAGHSVGKTLALGYVRTSHAWPGSKLIVQIGGRPVVATVTPTPFFDPTGARIRAKASDGPERVNKAKGT